MTDAVPREVAEAFYDAFASRDPARIAAFIGDDVDWLIVGPVDLLPFCGQRRGKRAAMEVFERLVPEVLHIKAVSREALLIDGDQASALSKLSAIHRTSGRQISYRIAQFMQFRDNKIAVYRTVIDSFNAAEQMLGHPIDLDQDRLRAPAGFGDLVAV